MKKALVACAAFAVIGASSLLASASYQCDINKDGNFDVLDIIVMQKFLLGYSVDIQNKKSLDINEDGCIDIFDLGLMKREWIVNHQGNTQQPTTVPTEEITKEITEAPTTESETGLPATEPTSIPKVADSFTLEDIPPFDGENAFYIIGDNTPDVSDLIEIYNKDGVFEYYAPLDDLGRCGVTYASICQELMPTEERKEIGQVKPSGWQYKGDDGKWHSNNNKYDFVNGKYVYNRCHLIGFQLAGENDNKCNLITGTRYLNIDGMLPFENMIADYVHEQSNVYQNDVYVLYRVTPMYDGNDLVAKGVRMEGYSVKKIEEQLQLGEDICFDVFCYNVQPGVTIDYTTGRNWAAE